MKSVNVIFIVGIRSQYIKLASMQRAIHKFNIDSNIKINPIFINTGQHYDYELSQFISELGIHFDYTFEYTDKNPLSILGTMQIKIGKCINEICANQTIHWLVVFGDSNSTLAGAIIASRLHIPLIHIESGVRIGDKSSIEEINRIVTDHIAQIHFVSSEIDEQNLIKEGLTNNNFYSGDIVYDLVLDLSQKIKSGYKDFQNGYILCTIHREENLQSTLVIENILNVLSSYKRKVIFITHPRTKSVIDELKLENLENIFFTSSIPYKKLLSAIKGCSFLVTDSGTLQREAFYLKKRCLIRQDIAFWQSLIQAGIHRTFENSKEDFIEKLEWIEQAILKDYPAYFDFGNGTATNVILKKIVELSE